eukprot:CAMPEP_0194697316 /NCGR_PEP_ID=MMETSP0295-20121207/23337_1 /TAXON_ID=39354 /ORGANISM="Heterosigma akashiwo, Strain CCMP2393" /LENGTH=109 /DNA_ID=CAMNT_0039589931 /DNA_START=164 /DNA_END=489 /DNA_ORIENTATION=+
MSTPAPIVAAHHAATPAMVGPMAAPAALASTPGAIPPEAELRKMGFKRLMEQRHIDWTNPPSEEDILSAGLYQFYKQSAFLTQYPNTPQPMAAGAPAAAALVVTPTAGA